MQMAGMVISDIAGGLVGWNNGTITACYSTGNANGGDGVSDDVGRLVGRNNTSGTITASHGFSTVTREGRGVNRSGDASDTVGSASALTMANSSTMNENRWSTRVWDFGTDSQLPVLKWITGYNSSGATGRGQVPLVIPRYCLPGENAGRLYRDRRGRDNRSLS